MDTEDKIINCTEKLYSVFRHLVPNLRFKEIPQVTRDEIKEALKCKKKEYLLGKMLLTKTY